MLFRRPYRTLPMKKASLASFAPDSILIDIREAEEFAQGHIAGAVHIPLEALSSLPPDTGLRSAQIYVYCQSGERSPAACRLLSKGGFYRVTNLAGGLDQWNGHLERD
jgi:rhodanese-related sulfurtransferase